MIPISLMVPTRDAQRFAERIGSNMLPFAQVVLYVQEPWTDGDSRRARQRMQGAGVQRVTILRGPAMRKEEISHVDWALKMLEHCTQRLVMMADDDLLFRDVGTLRYLKGSRERIEDAVRYLERHPKCVAIMQTAYLGGSIAGEQVVPTKNGLIAIDRGLIFRRRSATFYRRIGIGEQIGALAETLLTYPLLEEPDAYHAKQFNVPTRRILDGIYKWSYADGTAWVRERYTDATWTHEARRLPKGLQR